MHSAAQLRAFRAAAAGGASGGTACPDNLHRSIGRREVRAGRKVESGELGWLSLPSAPYRARSGRLPSAVLRPWELRAPRGAGCASRAGRTALRVGDQCSGMPGARSIAGCLMWPRENSSAEREGCLLRRTRAFPRGRLGSLCLSALLANMPLLGRNLREMFLSSIMPFDVPD